MRNVKLKSKSKNFSFFFAVFLFAFFAFHLPAASAARLYVFPSFYELPQGETMVAELRLDTQGERVNALDLRFSYDPSVVGIEDVSVGGSPFPLQVQGPSYSNDQGSFGLAAGAPGGFQGQGVLAHIVFRGAEQGISALEFGAESQVLLHDGQGTLAALSFGNGEMRVVPTDSNTLQIFAEDQPQENVWYSTPFIRINWQVKEGYTYSYILTRDPAEMPDEVPDQPVGDIKLDTTEDGIFYFRLRECLGGACEAAVTRRVMKDTRPPEPFDIQFAQDTTAFEGKPFVSFYTSDDTSGVERYEVSLVQNGQEGAWQATRSPYVLESVKGIEVIRVRAADKAGNQAMAEFYPQRGQFSYSILVLFAILIGIAIFVLLYLLWRKKMQKSKLKNQNERENFKED